MSGEVRSIHFIHPDDTAKRRARGDGPLTPDSVKTFCTLLELNPLPAVAVLRQTVLQAARLWPQMIRESDMLSQQKSRLTAAIARFGLMQSALRRNVALAEAWKVE